MIMQPTGSTALLNAPTGSPVVGSSIPQTPAPNPAPVAKSGGSWWQRLLPTAGSILGGIAGEVVDPFGGGIAGAALGGGLGKAGENALTHQKVLQGNVLTSAIEGGAGQGVGDLASAGIGAALGKGADFVGSGLLKSQFKGGLDDDALNSLSNDLGVTNATKQVKPMADIVTGKNGFLTTGGNTALGDANKGVDLSGLNDEARRLTSENQTLLADPSGKSIIGPDGVVNHTLVKALNDQPGAVTMLAQKGGGQMPQFALDDAGNSVLKGISPDSGFKATQDFEALARDALANSGTKMNPVADQAAKYKIFSGLARYTKDATYGSGDDAIPITDANRAQMVQDASKLNDIGENKAYNHFVGKLTAKNSDGSYVIQNAQDLRPLAAPLVRGSKVLDDVSSNAFKNGGISAQDIAQAGLGIASNPLHGVVGAVANHLPLEGMATTGLGKVANLADKTTPDLSDSLVGNLYKKATGKAIPKDLTDTLSGSAKAVKRAGQAAIPTTVSQTLAHAPNDVAPPQPTASSISPISVTSSTTGGTMNQTPSEANILSTAYNQLQNYGDLGPGASSITSLINTLAPKVQSQELASPAIQALLNSYSQAGGAQGLSGLESKLSGIIPGTAANQYNRNISGADAALQSLGLPSATVNALTPQLTSTPGVANNQISALQQILAQLPGNNSVIPGGYAQ